MYEAAIVKQSIELKLRCSIDEELDVFDRCREVKMDSNSPADRRNMPTVRRRARGNSFTYPPARWALGFKSRVEF